MARKKLLSEGEVRQFMKLANLGALSENYFSMEEDEEEVIDELPVEDEEIVDELPGEEDMGLEAPDEGAEGLVMSLLQRVQDWAEENGVEMDLDGSEGGELEDAELEDEVPLPDEEMGMMDVEAEEEIPMQEDDLYEGEEADVEEGMGFGTRSHNRDRSQAKGSAADRVARRKKREREKEAAAPADDKEDDAMVAEVVRRVAARLKGAKQTSTVADQLAERIFDRLTSKSK
jgi:hypothetical protein|tara:strand:+ start:3827 stop:4519 length:693 start_codon:yes stop_codon:yes gene_type:complete